MASQIGSWNCELGSARPQNHTLRRAGLLRQFVAIPISASSLIARPLLDRCVKPMPRNTFGAFENWTFVVADDLDAGSQGS